MALRRRFAGVVGSALSTILILDADRQICISRYRQVLYSVSNSPIFQVR